MAGCSRLLQSCHLSQQQQQQPRPVQPGPLTSSNPRSSATTSPSHSDPLSFAPPPLHTHKHARSTLTEAADFKQKFEEAGAANAALLGAAEESPSAAAAEEGQAAAGSTDADDLADEVTSKVTVADKPAEEAA